MSVTSTSLLNPDSIPVASIMRSVGSDTVGKNYPAGQQHRPPLAEPPRYKATPDNCAQPAGRRTGHCGTTGVLGIAHGSAVRRPRPVGDVVSERGTRVPSASKRPGDTERSRSAGKALVGAEVQCGPGGSAPPFWSVDTGRLLADTPVIEGRSLG
jgi:hypothetical protein